MENTKIENISKKRKKNIKVSQKEETKCHEKKRKVILAPEQEDDIGISKGSTKAPHIKSDTGKILTKVKELVDREQQPKSHSERIDQQKSLYRPPTSEELKELKENENLYKNNIFRLQMSYLLEDVKIEEKKSNKINAILHSLHEFLKSIPGRKDNFQLSDCDALPFKAVYPIPELVERSKITGIMTFQKPADVKVVGSYLLKTMTKPGTCIDIAVVMPKLCFQDRDYLNFKYHSKRAMYLCYIADHLKSWEHTSDMTFVTKEGDPYKPTLKLKLKGKVGKSVSLRILVCLPDGVFKLNRFSLATNNVRENWLHKKIEDGNAEKKGYSTPSYNASVLSDMLLETHLQSIYNAIGICDGMRDAICLFKVWLQQRNFQSNSRFNGFVGTMLMVYLLGKKMISAHMSSYQIFRIALHTIATTDWTEQGLCMAEKDMDVDMKSFHKMYPVVFVDTSGYLNLCANVDKISYQMVRNEAKICMELLDNGTADSFDCLFMKKLNFFEATDHAFRLNQNDDIKLNEYADNQIEKMADLGGNWTTIVVQQIMSILEKGLNQRVRKLMLKSNNLEWSINSMPPTPSINDVCFGLCLDTDHSDSVLEMGPSAGTTEALQFREFWGTKCQLRRFADGSINEAVVWTCQNAEEKKMVPRQIIFHLLKEHLSIASENISYHGDQLNSLLKRRVIESADNKKTQGTGEEEARHFYAVFEELRKQVSNLEDLPLAVRSMDGIDAVFRLTEVSSPIQRNCKNAEKSINLPDNSNCQRWCPANKVVLQLEPSGKWPTNVDAMQNVKAAFHLKLAQGLQEQCSMSAVANPRYVDVSKNGYLFRLMIADFREMLLCRDSLETGAIKRAFEQKAKELDILINKRTVHNNLIHSLNGVYVAYAETARLAKRWIAAQMMSPYVVDETVELLVAHVFLSPAPLEAPRSHITGFIRFLKLLATHTWEYDPLIVNLNNQMPSEEISELKEAFSSKREQMAEMHIISPYDKESSMWTKENISKVVSKRLTALAAAAFNIICDDQVLSGLNVKQLFRTGLQDYDLIIKLRKKNVPRYYSAVDTTMSLKPYTPKSLQSSAIMVNDFDPPMQYLKELQTAFSDIAMFFYDKYGGLNIGVVWKKHQMTPQSFKILNAGYKKVSMTKDDKEPSLTSLVVPNVDAILTDFKIMGKGLIDDIIINTL